MVSKKLSEIKQGNKILIDGVVYTIIRIEQSDIGKHGKAKCRLELEDERGNKSLLIRLSDFEVELK